MGQVTPTRFSVTFSEEEIPVNLNTSSSIKNGLVRSNCVCLTWVLLRESIKYKFELRGQVSNREQFRNLYGK